MTTSVSSDSSAHAYPQPFPLGSSRQVGWSARQSFEHARDLAGRSFMTMLTWYEVAQQRRVLRMMSTEMLDDIGVSRVDALREASRRFWDVDRTS